MLFTDGIPFGTKSTAILISTTSLFLLLTAIHFILLLIGGELPLTTHDQFISDKNIITHAACCKVKAFVYRKKSLVSSLVILLVLLFMCISSSFALGIISYGKHNCMWSKIVLLLCYIASCPYKFSHRYTMQSD